MNPTFYFDKLKVITLQKFEYTYIHINSHYMQKNK